jgi:exodeoxyribonuclease V alpha subunit
MSNYPTRLRAYVELEVVRERDLSAAGVFADLAQRSGATVSHDGLWIAMALALAAFRDQHVCVDFDSMQKWQGDIDLGNPSHPFWSTQSNDWYEAVSQCPELVEVVTHTGGSQSTAQAPFILDGSLFYLARAWHQESAVFEAFSGPQAHNISVVMGGPGSGKTTSVARHLVELLSHEESSHIRVALAAPTGKAAQRMTEALEKQLNAIDAPEEIRRAVAASPARTVHSLLGYAPQRLEDRFTYNARNTLPYDLVIIDETSMLSLSMMFHLLRAIRDDARVMLVGDPYQLASVDAGTVLADISALSERSDLELSRHVTRLTGQYRFASDSPIALLSSAIREGNVEEVFNVLGSGHQDCQWIDPKENEEDLRSILDAVVKHAQELVSLASAGKSVEALATQRSMQVLCAVRHGRFGVSGWNSAIEKRLGMAATAQWYVGRPLMITVNDKSTELFNGDVGLICAQQPDGRAAVFGEEGNVRTVPLTRLPNLDTVHALTIHKSQGSEYDHAVVVLPIDGSRILSRELLYTAVTRARKSLTIIGSPDAIQSAVETPITRATGLSRRRSVISK